MEWERAKNYILIAFVILNLGLFTLLFLEDSRYTLTPHRTSNIHAVLSDNNINLYATLMRRFVPMRHLEVSGFYYDVSALIEVFFEAPENVLQKKTEEGHYIFETEDAFLEIFNGFITFDNRLDLGINSSDEAKAITHTAAIQISDEFIAKHFPDFVRDIVHDQYNGDGVHIIYSQEYNGRLISTNMIELLVTARGKEWIEMQFGRVIGYSTELHRIFAPDEALLTFMQRMRHVARENPIFITNIDMVYMKEYASDQIGTVYPAVPFYRIFIRDREFPFLINAYTNVMK